MTDRCQECGAELGPVEYLREVETVIRHADGRLETRVTERVVCVECIGKEATDATDDT